MFTRLESTIKLIAIATMAVLSKSFRTVQKPAAIDFTRRDSLLAQHMINDDAENLFSDYVSVPMQQHLRTMLIGILSITVAFGGYSGGLPTFAPSSIAAVAAEPAWTDRNRLAAETWRAVDELYFDRTFNGQDWFKLRQDVVKKKYTTDSELYSSLQSMIGKLGDKYTRFLTPAQYSALLNSARGELVGIGVELVASESGGTVIDRVENSSPAMLAGMQKGDVVLNVDGTDTKALSPEETAAIMRGRLDTKASLRVARSSISGGREEQLDFTVTRAPIKLQGVTWNKYKDRTLSKNVGYVKIRSFASNTREEVTQALEELHRGDTLDALVIDLRDNGGGALQGAVETSNLLLRPGKIVVFTVSKDGLTGAQQTLPSGVLSADPSLPDLTTPCFVLVNSNTASAAEVFAAALKENGRASLVGEKTFGKGIIQNLQQLREGGVAVTTARYETPLHNNINKIGIEVDTRLECVNEPDVNSCISRVL